VTQQAPPEETVWEGSPSHWSCFGTYVLSVLLAGLFAWGAVYFRSKGNAGFLGSWNRHVGLAFWALEIVPLILMLRAFILTKSTTYKLTTERILTASGILFRKTDNLELYRVDDFKVLQPFFLRLVGKGTLVVVASDRSSPELPLEAVPDTQGLRDKMRKHVEACRDRKRTRVVDLEQG